MKHSLRFTGSVLRETEKALLVELGWSSIGEREVWIPKSQMRDVIRDDGTGISFDLPYWLAAKNNIQGLQD